MAEPCSHSSHTARLGTARLRKQWAANHRLMAIRGKPLRFNSEQQTKTLTAAVSLVFVYECVFISDPA